MVEHLGCLPLVKSEVESKSSHEGGNSNVKHHEWPVSMPMAVERIVSKLVPVWLVVGVWLVNNQVCVRVWGENVLMAVEIRFEK